MRLRVLARQAEWLQAAAQAEWLQAVVEQLQVLRFQVREAAVFQMAAGPRRPR
jgi:hypothetical protein